jgi:hypothetical protein
MSFLWREQLPPFGGNQSVTFLRIRVSAPGGHYFPAMVGDDRIVAPDDHHRAAGVLDATGRHLAMRQILQIGVAVCAEHEQRCAAGDLGQHRSRPTSPTGLRDVRRPGEPRQRGRDLVLQHAHRAAVQLLRCAEEDVADLVRLVAMDDLGGAARRGRLV